MSFTIRYEVMPSVIYTMIRRDVEDRGEIDIRLRQNPDTGLWSVSGTKIAALDELAPSERPDTLLWIIGLILKGDPQLCPPPPDQRQLTGPDQR